MRRSTLAALLMTSVTATAAAQEAAPRSPKPGPALFADARPLELTLTGRLSQHKRQRTGEATWLPGTITWRENGEERRVSLRLRSRGIWRRRHCDIPPLLLDFAKDSVRKTPFAGIDRLRLTLPCRLNADHEQYVLQEFQLYRVHRLLSPYSFDARLARVTYIDADKKDTVGTWWSFVSEQDEPMAERNGAKLITLKGAGQSNLHPYESAFTGVFQYFVGNADWSITGLHNIVLIEKDFEYLPVPRDFDFSGAVNTRYATPPPQLKLRGVTERVMRGYCTSAAEYEKVFALFKARKDALYGLYADSLARDLRPGVRKETLAYFDDFYRVIDNPGRAKRDIVDACLGDPVR